MKLNEEARNKLITLLKIEGSLFQEAGKRALLEKLIGEDELKEMDIEELKIMVEQSLDRAIREIPVILQQVSQETLPLYLTSLFDLQTLEEELFELLLEERKREKEIKESLH